jgi:hypothetical protein
VLLRNRAKAAAACRNPLLRGWLLAVRLTASIQPISYALQILRVHT